MFGILNHYMLFVVFAWLMNEAFNLYITIIYAAHQSSPINDHGSQWRFYLLGYLLPAILVLVLILTKSKDYYDKKLCWFNLDNLWIDVSPMIAMITVCSPVFLQYNGSYIAEFFFQLDYDSCDDHISQRAYRKFLHKKSESKQTHIVRKRIKIELELNSV